MFIIDGNLLSVISALNNFNNIDDGSKNKKSSKNSTNLFGFKQLNNDVILDNFAIQSDKNKNVEDDFKDALTSGNSYWEDDYANSMKTKRNMSKMVELTPKEQTKLKELVDKYYEYKKSLSSEEQAKLDKDKVKFLARTINSEENYSDNPYVMTKLELLDILQTTDISNNKVDGKIGSFRQGGVGDCWLLSALKNISTSEENSKILKDSVILNKDGSYTVKFKGLENYVKKIADDNYYKKFIKTNMYNDIEKQLSSNYPDEFIKSLNIYDLIKPNCKPKNKIENDFITLFNSNKYNSEYIKLNKEKKDFIKEKTKLLNDGVTITREQLDENSYINEKGKEVTYAIGDKDVTLIEMATEKVVKTVTDGTLDAATPDIANLLLLNKKSTIYQQRPADYQKIELFSLVFDGKISEEEFFEKMNYLPISDDKKAEWIKKIENTPAEMLMAGSIPASTEDKREYKENKNPDTMFIALNSEKLGNRRIFKSHAYNISKVDKENKLIYVQNPWEPGIQIPISYEEFFKCYSSMYVLND